MDIKYIVAGTAGIVIFLVFFAVNSLVSRKQRVKELEREARYTSVSEEMGFEQGLHSPVELEKEASGLARALEHFMRILGIDVDKALMESKLELSHAGIDSPSGRVYLLFYKRILSFIVFTAGALLMLRGDDASLAIGAFLIIIGLFGAKLYISNSTQKRKKELVRSFPDSLDLLVVCVESGLALDAALNRVCDELGYAHPELTKELNRTRLELALLNNRSQALANLSERTDIVAFRSLVAALIQTERFGTNLTDTLRVLSDDYRQTRLMLAEEKAGRLPALMTIPLVCLLLPAFIIIILAPPFIKVHEQGGLFGNG